MIADYHERTALAASQVIAGFEPELFRETLEQTVVGLAVGRQAAKSKEGKVLAELTIRLLARLYPVLELRVELPDEAERLALLAQAINPRIELAQGASVGISIGDVAPAFETTYFAGSNGWDALLSAREPVKIGSSQNPFGAAVAACLAAGNVFNRVLMPDWEHRITRELAFSAFGRTRERTPDDIPNDGWKLVQQAVLVGAGAIGNGALWVLAASPLEGKLHIVDPEALELSNLQRYVLAVRSDEGRPKVHVAESHLHGPLEPVPHQQNWAEFVSSEGYGWPCVLVALDTMTARRSVQASLPKWIANSWTQPGDLGISIHGPFNGPGACLCCLYIPTSQLPNEDEIVARALGVPASAMEIRTLLHTGQGVSRQLIEAVAAGLNQPLEQVLPYEGRPVRELFVEGVCGGGIISLGSPGTPQHQLHVPLAHQSALAGALLASALVRRALLNSDEKTTMITRLDVLRGIGDDLTQPALKASNGLCICEDPDYLAAFQAKWPSPDASTEAAA
jgi:hypothetical protein